MKCLGFRGPNFIFYRVSWYTMFPWKLRTDKPIIEDVYSLNQYNSEMFMSTTL